MSVCWQKTEMGTEVLAADGWYISYNPYLPDTMGPETALVVEDQSPRLSLEKCLKIGLDRQLAEQVATMGTRRFYILCGDGRKEYEKAFPDGLEACLRVFLDNVDEYGSDDSDEITKEQVSMLWD